MSNGENPAPASWRIAEQGYESKDFELKTKPHDDGYVMEVCIEGKWRRVFFDAAGRVTYIRKLVFFG